MGMVVADLHVHTTNSDGQLTLERLPAAARAAGIETVAVTDHDRVHPDLDDPVTTRDDITIVSGIELRVEADDLRVDLLGYGVSKTDNLTAMVERLQEDRIERARAIVDRVEEETGIRPEVAFEPGVGRPHVAQAIDASDAPYDYDEAFEQLIADDRPCYVPRDIPTFERGVACLAEACAFVGLAHPLRYDSPADALELASELDAVELYYPYDHDADTTSVREAIDRHNLLATGGSDAHDDQLGRAGLDDEQFQPLSSRLGLD